MYKIGMSSCAFALTEENFGALSNSGVEAIEISMRLEGLLTLDCRAVAELAKRYGIDLWSYHLPFLPFREIDPSSLDPAVRKNTLDVFSELIKKASDVGIDQFVVHPSGEPIPDEIRKDRMLYSMEILDRLAEIAHRQGAIIAVEDLPRTCLGNTAADILRLISANDKLRVCFDTNHLLTESNLDFMEQIGDKIVTVHISDYDFIDEKHWLPGEGLLDWNAMLATFQKIGYKGVWMYELGRKSPKTLSRSRDLTFDDFVRNAREIFKGKTLTRVE
ncbi:MAG: sugar phosphate isomerase/epimerase [Ruminococcaceae bacterium]|nr:sugar phosphate isomerase/epimerase [Oscillospiraceae bacterium]